MDWNFIIFSVVKIAVVIGVLLTLVAYSVLAERKIAAWIQDRPGPNRVAPPFVKYIPILGPFLTRIGFFQPMADALKSVLKEDFTPAGVKKIYFWLAPAIAVIPALLTVAVIPFGSVMGGQKMVIADLNVGILYTFGIVSLGVYGIVLAGYSANSKYPFLGGIRSSSQMISYELALGLSVIPVFMICGTLNLPAIVDWQVQNGWLIAPWWPKGLGWHMILSGNWGAIEAACVAGFSWQRVALWIPMLISFFVFLVAMFAETNRLPFDFAEGESEIVAGFNTEYGSMKFSLLALAEYSHLMTASALVATLYVGGWQVPFVQNPTVMLSVASFLLKMLFFAWVFVWIRWTLPRFRYDQLMHLGWKVMLPLSMANLVFHAWRMSQGH